MAATGYTSGDARKMDKSANLSDVASASTSRTSLGLGTAAVTNTGTGAGNTILGNDARLTDSRTPTTHAASHASGGGDPVTLAQSQVTNLTTDLAALQPLDYDLTTIAGLSPSNDDIAQRKAGSWTNRTPAQFKTDLVLVKGDVGLGNVDNTSDANKPVSTATQTALDGKAATSHVHSAADVTSGTLVVSRGGTGVGSVTAGSYLKGAGTSALVERTTAEVLSDIGAAASAHTHTIRKTIMFGDDRPTLTTGTGTMRLYNREGVTLTIVGVWAAAGVVPTDAAILVDVHKGGTTIFTTQGNRPTVPDGGNGGAISATPDVTSLADGDYLTVDIDQVGASVAGGQLSVGVVVTYAG